MIISMILLMNYLYVSGYEYGTTLSSNSLILFSQKVEVFIRDNFVDRIMNRKISLISTKLQWNTV